MIIGFQAIFQFISIRISNLNIFWSAAIHELLGKSIKYTPLIEQAQSKGQEERSETEIIAADIPTLDEFLIEEEKSELANKLESQDLYEIKEQQSEKQSDNVYHLISLEKINQFQLYFLSSVRAFFCLPSHSTSMFPSKILIMFSFLLVGVTCILITVFMVHKAYRVLGRLKTSHSTKKTMIQDDQIDHDGYTYFDTYADACFELTNNTSFYEIDKSKIDQICILQKKDEYPTESSPFYSYDVEPKRISNEEVGLFSLGTGQELEVIATQGNSSILSVNLNKSSCRLTAENDDAHSQVDITFIKKSISEKNANAGFNKKKEEEILLPLNNLDTPLDTHHKQDGLIIPLRSEYDNDQYYAQSDTLSFSNDLINLHNSCSSFKGNGINLCETNNIAVDGCIGITKVETSSLEGDTKPEINILNKKDLTNLGNDIGQSTESEIVTENSTRVLISEDKYLFKQTPSEVNKAELLSDASRSTEIYTSAIFLEGASLRTDSNIPANRIKVQEETSEVNDGKEGRKHFKEETKPSKIPIISPKKNKPSIRAQPALKHIPKPEISDAVLRYFFKSESNSTKDDELFLKDSFGEDPEIFIDEASLEKLTKANISDILSVYEGSENSDNWFKRFEYFDVLIGNLRLHLPEELYDYFQNKLYERMTDILEITCSSRSKLLPKVIIFIRDFVYYGNNVTSDDFVMLIHLLLRLMGSKKGLQYISKTVMKALCLMIQSIDPESFICNFNDVFSDILSSSKTIGGEKYACLFMIKFYLLSNKDKLDGSEIDQIMNKLIVYIPKLCVDRNPQTRGEVIDIYLICKRLEVANSLLLDYHGSLTSYLKKLLPLPEE